MRHSVSSQKANRSASEPPPRATTIDLDLADGGEVLQRARDGRGAAWRSCTGAKAHTSRPAQPRRRSAGEHVVARLAALAGDDADASAAAAGRDRRFWGSNRPSARAPAQPLELGEQVALAGDAQAVTAKENDGDAVRAARVVVAAAGDDDLRAVGQRPGREPQRLEVVAPHRARQRAVARRAARSRRARGSTPQVPNTSPNSCTRANPRSRSRSWAA